MMVGNEPKTIYFTDTRRGLDSSNRQRMIGFGKGNIIFWIVHCLAHSSYSRKYFCNELLSMKVVISRIIQGLLYFQDHPKTKYWQLHVG